MSDSSHKTDSWLNELRLQLPSAQVNYDSISKVTYYDDTVNSYSMPNDGVMQSKNIFSEKGYVLLRLSFFGKMVLTWWQECDILVVRLDTTN